MAKALQRRRGTNEEHKSFTGLEGEFTYDTTEKRIVAHDGSTKGGIPMAKKSELDTKLNTSGGTMTGRLTVKYGYRGITQQFASGETFSDYSFLDESGNLIGNIRTTKASSGVRSIAISANGTNASGGTVWKSLTIGAGPDGSGAFCAFDSKNVLTEETGAAKDHTHTSFKVSSGRPVMTFQSGATASSIAFKDVNGAFKGEIGIGAGGVPIFIDSSYSVKNMIHAGNISSYASTGTVSLLTSGTWSATSSTANFTVTGVTAYKPLYLIVKPPSYNQTNVGVVSGVVDTVPSILSMSDGIIQANFIKMTSYDGRAGTLVCIPNATSITIQYYVAANTPYYVYQ